MHIPEEAFELSMEDSFEVVKLSKLVDEVKDLEQLKELFKQSLTLFKRKERAYRKIIESNMFK